MVATEEYDEERWRPDLHLLKGLSVAAFAIDSARRMTYCNTAASTRIGPQAAELIGTDVLEQLFPVTSAATLDEVLAQVLAGGSWTGELPVLGPDGIGHMTETSWSAVYDGHLRAPRRNRPRRSRAQATPTRARGASLMTDAS